MSLLGEIRDAAVDSEVSLSVVLRKSKVLAARLGHEAFKKWVDQELNGYRLKGELPEYRIISVESRGYFSGPFGSGLNNAPIPPGCLPENFRELASIVYLTDGVSAYEALVKQGGGSTCQSPWPADLIVSVGSEIYEGLNCLSAWRVIPSNSLVAVLDTVRNRILNFVLEIEEEAPEAGEAKPGTRPLPGERVNQVFNTYILGGNNNLASGSSNFTQNVVNTVQKGDFDSLRSYLASLGVSAKEIQELEKAIQQDGEPQHPRQFGEKVAGWIGKMTSKAVSGAWSGVTAAAAELLFKAVASYYGIPQ
ncbi:MAG: hypothetical protein M1358_08805 [Chloroflexi bacterium]|nr:hypothetical protein [Chloroflexota bacterium]